MNACSTLTALCSHRPKANELKIKQELPSGRSAPSTSRAVRARTSISRAAARTSSICCRSQKSLYSRCADSTRGTIGALPRRDAVAVCKGIAIHHRRQDDALKSPGITRERRRSLATDSLLKTAVFISSAAPAGTGRIQVHRTAALDFQVRRHLDATGEQRLLVLGLLREGQRPP